MTRRVWWSWTVGVVLLASAARAVTIRVPTEQPTVQTALAVMHPGDVVSLGPGVFEGPFTLSVPCTVAARCTIRGAGEGVTILRGMREPADWTMVSPGIYRRTMEPSVDPILVATDGWPMRDVYDPAGVYQERAFTEPDTGEVEHLPLGYAGDSVAAPGPGQWSYNPTTHAITVHPYNAADPSTIFVPFLSRMVDLRRSTGHWTFADLSFEGSRGSGMDHNFSDGQTFGDVIFQNVGAGYFEHWFTRFSPCVGCQAHNLDLRWLGRGASPVALVTPTTHQSAWGLRWFMAAGAVYDGLTCRHLGSGSGFCGGACLPPWGGNTFSTNGMNGHCVDVKQTDGFDFGHGWIDDGPIDGNLKIDVSRNGTIHDSYFSRNVKAVVLNNQTPATTPFGSFTATYNITVATNLFDASNLADVTVQEPLSSGSPIVTLNGNVRTLGPLRTETCPSSPTVCAPTVFVPPWGLVVTGSTTTTAPPTLPTTTTSSTTTSTSTTSTSSTTTSSTTSTTTTTTLPPCPFPCVP